MARSWPRNSGSRALAGARTSSPAAFARAATGPSLVGRDLERPPCGRCPRPAGAAGRVTTATTSCREASSASSAGTAVCGVPANTRRMVLQRLTERRMRRRLDHGQRLAEPLGLSYRLHRELALLRVEPVDEQHAIQMVGLVL